MNELKKQYEALGGDATDEQIRLAVENLERRQFMPTLILAVPNFLHLRRADMLAEFDRVVALEDDNPELARVIGLNDAEEVKKKHLEVLLHQYNLLCGLRVGDGDAWIIINELYEDD